MQLKRFRSIRHTLTAVTATLVGASSAAPEGLNHSETSILIYSEQDRVRATEVMYSVNKQLRNAYVLDLRFTYDGLTGASPTGASPSKRPQTLTRASGGGRVLVEAGELPADQSFGETRFAFDGTLARNLSSGMVVSGGLHLSGEHDYKSVGLSAGIIRDLDSAETNLGLSLSVLRDLSSPVGGLPEPLSLASDTSDTDDVRRISHGDGRKHVYDASLSLTRVLGPNLLARLSYTFDRAEGYLTDPYKVVSVVQAADSVDPGEPVYALHESRPTSRTSGALACELRTFLLGMVTEGEYRYFWDDWGVRSHTAYFSLKLDMKRTGDILPHLRWYHQDRARFSRPFLVQGASLPTHVSADSRLATFDALTYGMTYSVPTSPASRLILSMEWYSQRGDRSPPESFGPLLAFNLFPDLNAFMLRVGLSHDF